MPVQNEIGGVRLRCCDLNLIYLQIKINTLYSILRCSCPCPLLLVRLPLLAQNIPGCRSPCTILLQCKLWRSATKSTPLNSHLVLNSLVYLRRASTESGVQENPLDFFSVLTEAEVLLSFLFACREFVSVALILANFSFLHGHGPALCLRLVYYIDLFRLIVILFGRQH